jgi:hypothetical protein
VHDKKENVSPINPVTKDLVLNDRLVAYWTDDPTYAVYRLSSFKAAWTKLIPAADRIQELLKEASELLEDSPSAVS